MKRLNVWLLGLMVVFANPLMNGFAAEPDGLSVDSPTVLITGANRGIGFEFVKQYADLGWNVIATCRNPDSAQELAELVAQHDNVSMARLDLTDHEGIDALAAEYAGNQ